MNYNKDNFDIDFYDGDDDENFVYLDLTDEDIEHLLKSEDDIENGRVINIEDIFKELDRKYGI